MATSPSATPAAPDDSSFVYPLDADSYSLYAEIGVGAFAIVYAANVKTTGEKVAVKILNLDGHDTNWDGIRAEINTMRQMNHPNVVPVLASFVAEEELWIVMPLLAGGSCAAINKKLFPDGIKDESVLATILLGALEALEYFHKDGFIHRDIKAGNILISENGTVQLADFGVAGTLIEHGDRKEHRGTFVGTPCWMAPEVMEQQTGYDCKADIWSFGITALELAFGHAPYAKYPPMKVLLLTLQEEPPTQDVYKTAKLSKAFSSMVGKCLRKDPNQRPAAAKLKKHKFFKLANKDPALLQMIVQKLPPIEPQPPEKARFKREQRRLARKPISVEGAWSFGTQQGIQLRSALEQGKAAELSSDQEDGSDTDLPPNPTAVHSDTATDEANQTAEEKQAGRFTYSDADSSANQQQQQQQQQTTTTTTPSASPVEEPAPAPTNPSRFTTD